MSLILLDLDGTIIGQDGGVAEAIWRAAEKLRARGVRLAVCTGRTHAGVALRIAERLDAEAPHIFHNGALITTATGHVLDTTPLGKAALRRLVAHARRLEVTVEFYTPGDVYVDRITDECARHADVLEISPVERDLDEVVATEEVIRAHWIIDPELIDAALDVDTPHSNTSTATSPALPGLGFISVTHERASKGTGAAFAADYLGVDLADVIGVGDSHSDIPMLERVGHPFVMADGDAELCRRFPTVGAVGDDGVLEAFASVIE